ncbi:hypothetical protein FDECE_861 [Fusarium decemcellulare]|nr:hypothetical protein FDECE_861 [Fusarium decemcellulare]
MAMADKILLFDLPSKDDGCSCWSLNTWKIRLALNYKGIDYETQWVEYPDIEPLLKPLGLEPQQDQIKPYTLPAIRTPDGQHFMNSRVIIAELERRYPELPLYPDNPVTKKAHAVTGPVLKTLWGVILPQIHRKVLNTASAGYFWDTRKEVFGMSLDTLEAAQGGSQAWERSRPKFEKVAEALRETDGPFFLGTTVSFADFILVGFLHFLKRAAGDEEFRRVEEWPEIVALYQACAKWLQRDSY